MSRTNHTSQTMSRRLNRSRRHKFEYLEAWQMLSADLAFAGAFGSHAGA
jgi:hypothetical protein